MFRWPSSVSCGWSPASGGPGPRCTCTGVGGYALGCVTRLLPGPSGSSGRKKVSPASPHSPRPSLGSCSCGPVTLPIPAQRGHLGGPQRRLSIPRTSDVAACFRGGCRDGVPWTGRSAHSKGTLRTWGHQSRTASEWRFPPATGLPGWPATPEAGGSPGVDPAAQPGRGLLVSGSECTRVVASGHGGWCRAGSLHSLPARLQASALTSW